MTQSSTMQNNVEAVQQPAIFGPKIDISNLSLNLGNTQILQDVSFSVAAGSIHCIVGANGGGKTSLLRCLLGQMPHAGKIDIHWPDKQTIGYVPQHLDFDKTLPVTVWDFLTIATSRRPAFLWHAKQHRVDLHALLEKFGLAEKSQYKLGSLSGGERQRAIFAQAFSPMPSLLVLDEPMTGLDVAGSDMVLDIVRDFAARGGTVIWINHDIAQVNQVADRLTYIDKTLMLDGSPNEVLHSGAALKLFPTLQLTENTQSEAPSIMPTAQSSSDGEATS